MQALQVAPPALCLDVSLDPAGGNAAELSVTKYMILFGPAFPSLNAITHSLLEDRQSPAELDQNASGLCSDPLRPPSFSPLPGSKATHTFWIFNCSRAPISVTEIYIGYLLLQDK